MRRSVSSPDETLKRELHWKYDAQRSIFDGLRGVSSGDETQSQMLDIILLKQNDSEEEIKDAKMSSFSFDF